MEFSEIRNILITDQTQFKANKALQGSDIYFGSCTSFSLTMNVLENSVITKTVGNSIYGYNANVVITNVEFSGLFQLIIESLF